MRYTIGVTDRPRLISVGEEEEVKVTPTGLVYYGHDGVSEDDNEGTVDAGQTLDLLTSKWFATGKDEQAEQLEVVVIDKTAGGALE